MKKKMPLILSAVLIGINLIIFSMIFIRIQSYNAKAANINMNEIYLHHQKATSINSKSLPANNARFIPENGKNIVFLTFDDGPNGYTNEILDILKTYGISSTFFLLSPNIEKHPEIVKRMAEEGHSIGCHGVTHNVSKFYKNPASPLKEMQSCQKSLASLVGEETALIRVPFGSVPLLTAAQKKELDKGNFILWDWNVDSQDWKRKNAKKMTASVLNQVHAIKEKGEIPVILFHDKEITKNALPDIIDGLIDMGFTFRAISPDDIPVQF